MKQGRKPGESRVRANKMNTNANKKVERWSSYKRRERRKQGINMQGMLGRMGKRWKE